MAKTHSKLAVFKLDTAGGALTDISAYITEVNLSGEMDEVDCTTLGATSRQYLAGFSEHSIELSGMYERAQDQMFQAVYDAFKAGTLTSVSFEYGPEGASSGDVKKTGEAILLTYETPVSIDDPVGWSASLRVTGDITTTTY
jgi:predicted secreted protein